MTEVAAAARRTLAAGTARIRRDVFDPAGDEVVIVYEGRADIARRRVRLDPVNGELSRVYADGALRHEAQDGTWAIFDRRPGRGDPLAILDWLAVSTSAPVAGDERDVRGVSCEQVDFRTDEPLAIGRAWIGPDDRLRRLDWRMASGTRVRIELWDFGIEADIAVPDAEQLSRWSIVRPLLRAATRRRPGRSPER